jgi:hypothetical protein
MHQDPAAILTAVVKIAQGSVSVGSCVSTIGSMALFPCRWAVAPVPAGMGLVLGFLAGITAVVAAWLLGEEQVTVVGLVLSTLAAAAVSFFTTPAGATASAAMCWAYYDGFALNRLGELHFAAADLRALAVIGGTAVVVAGCAMLLHALAAAATACDQRRSTRFPPP